MCSTSNDIVSPLAPAKVKTSPRIETEKSFLDPIPAASPPTSKTSPVEPPSATVTPPTTPPPLAPLKFHPQKSTTSTLPQAPPSELTQPDEAKARWSSGCKFYPQGRYWRIGGEWYDFTEFIGIHPGGAEIITLSRDRFDDSTFAFEAHHIDYARARAVIKKYKLPDDVSKELNSLHSIPNGPKLLNSKSFYSVLRKRVNHYFKSNNLSTGPTTSSLFTFYACFILWLCSVCLTLSTSSVFAAILQGYCGAVVGAFGHNWVHQPNYRHLAPFSLDVIGFSSHQWFREHILQHHMFTNTPLDNHFLGTAPFLITDPTVERHWIQAKLTPYFNPVILVFGLPGNWIIHLVEAIQGHETKSLWKLFIPCLVALYFHVLGVRGLVLFFVNTSFMSIFYFTLALMNHNSDHCHDTLARNDATTDWGLSQLSSCADWGVNSSFLRSLVTYLGLNYHCVHHLFPTVDFCHHQALQTILMETCKDCGVTSYEIGEFVTIYKEMVGSFASGRSVGWEVVCYNGS